ncbi:sensor histidine kinase [Microbispora oryzae]|uniref:sensor histidine kinase n=1 Tax=Microbispora oryzae TaxID=2806554 RepID=UPI0027DE306D|nr:histidine kinase [Microbispora oryzae]
MSASAVRLPSDPIAPPYASRGRRAAIAADVALGVALAGVLAFWAGKIADRWGGAYWAFDCATGAVVSTIALLRRWNRAWAAAGGLAVTAVALPVARFAGLPSEPGPATALALSVLVGSAISALPARAACAVAAGGLAVAGGSVVTAHAFTAGVPAVTSLNAVTWLAAVAVGLGLRLLAARRRFVADKVRRDERLEIARELHDVVARHVTAIVLQAQAARLVAGRHPGPRPGQLDDTLAGIESAGSEALAAMRRVVGLLRDADDAAPATFGERLGDLVERFGGHGPAVHLRLPDGEDESAWPPEVAGTVYRIVQESLTNIARHAANATAVTIGVTRDGDTLVVEVLDDAPPAAARLPRRGGYGLVGMRERAEALGGALFAGPRAVGGWSVRATLPAPVRDRR